MNNRFSMVVAVHLVLLSGEKVLLARRFNTGYEDGNYSVAAGHVEEGESCSAAMIREAREEMGISIMNHDLIFGHVMHRNENRESIDFFFLCKKWTGTPTIQEKDKCDQLLWCKVDDLPSNTIGYVRKGIAHSLKKNEYSESGFSSD